MAASEPEHSSAVGEAAASAVRERTAARRSALACLRLVLATAPAKAALVLALMLASFVTEGFGLLLLVPLMGVVGLDIGQGQLAGVERMVASAFEAMSIRPTLLAVLLVYVAINTARALLDRWRTIAATELDYTVINALRGRLYRAISHLPWIHFVTRRSSDLTNMLTGELDRVAYAISELIRLSSHALVALVYAAIAVFVSPLMTAIAVASGSALSMYLARGHDKARRAGEDISETADDLYSAVTQHIGAVKTTKSFGAEERNLSTFTDVATRSANAYLHALKDYSRVSTMHAIGAVVILAALVYVGVEVLRFPVAAILLLLFLFARLVPRISALHQSYYSALSSLPAFTRVISVADEFESLAETPVRGTERLALVDEVALSDVRFSYRPEARDNVVERVRMRIAAQQTTAIVGPSGAGKSTLADIVMGLLAPNEGDVLVDGRVLRPGQVGSWRRGIGYVAQDTFLFHASVEENLRWASPHASEADLWEALSLAAADDFVRRLPQGLGTAIGDRGVLLSGGERQRIALARALLRKPSLLILDEATSSLDAENEQRIQQAIADLHGRLTILIITHRLTTVRDADVIYVVDAGRIVEHGDWDDLIARPYGRFRALCAAMGMGEEIPLVSESLGRS